ncbi:MAG TPA: 3-carboxy-cis,cis-muconate cycloisomerase [Actinomycetes bacterium]|nr:3-carboxy-cis,cis-muconate cycloisomerase [Actinomycetes bacterium]
MPETGLFDEVLARGRVREAVSDRAYLAAMLAAEAALARVQRGAIPDVAATAIAAVCDVDRYDIAALGTAARGPGNPVLPLVEALRAAVAPAAAEFVHRGATSQDILDTATMLVAHRALGALLDDVTGAADAAAGLARAHAGTGMAGRTLLQHAMPVTFGLKAAGWMVALDEAAHRLAEVRQTRLAAQLGGAVGTQEAFRGSGSNVTVDFASELGLVHPVLPWHTNRTRVAELAGALATAAGVLARIARDVTLLAQTEVGEVVEAEPGRSSAMPHKRNPVAAVSAYACASQAPGLAATLFAAMAQEHERAAGAWQAEWRPLRELLVSVGSGAAWLRQCLAGLTVNEAAMAANLARLCAEAGVADLHEHLLAAENLAERALAARDHLHAAAERLADQRGAAGPDTGEVGVQ